MPTDTHTAADGARERIADLRAMMDLLSAGSAGGIPAAAAERLRDRLDYVNADPADASDDAYDLAAGYVYGAHVLMLRDQETGTTGSEASRVEMVLAGGGPTHILTWDERGSGWSHYFDSWASPDHYQPTTDEWETIGAFVEAFIAPPC